MIGRSDLLPLARSGALSAELRLRPATSGLGQLPVRLHPAATRKSICGFCSTGCSLNVHLDAAGAAFNLSPDPAHPVNLGRACPKGWEALTPLAAADRATTPLLRQARTGTLAPLGWPEALRTFVTRLQAIQARHGPDSIAFLSTGQIPTEEMALLGALFKFGMGGRHADSNTRQCMATAHVAYKESFGFDAPPYTYADFEAGDVLVFVGANPCIAHPILWQRVMGNRHRPEIVVIDPRRTETAMCATRHVALRPRSDHWLFLGIAHELIAHGWIDGAFLAAHTRGYEELADFVRDYPPSRCAEETGLAPAEIRGLAQLIAHGRAVSFWWTMGVNQGHDATRTAQAIINVALLTGNLGRPGTGANSITGQCNAMGSRLFANTTSLFGGRRFQNAADRAAVARILEIPERAIPAGDSWAYDEILDGIGTGRIRALWVIGTNPAHSWIERSRWAELRRRLEFLVVQDMYASTETAQLADLVLPAAGWGEKEGTFINSERRFGVVRKLARAPGEALADFAIFQLIAEAWGCGDLFRRWSSPAAVFAILQELSRGQPCDFTGIRDYDHLEAAGGIQWPFTAADAAQPAPPPGERRLFADGRFFTADGRAHLVFAPPRPPPEVPDKEFPFWLNTGRGSSAQWHTGTRTDKSAVLRALAPREPCVEIHPADAARHGVTAGQRVILRSRRGRMTAHALVTPTVPAGQVFVAMHWPEVNRLTCPAFDPHSRQPGYKACAVRLEKESDEPRSWLVATGKRPR